MLIHCPTLQSWEVVDQDSNPGSLAEEVRFLIMIHTASLMKSSSLWILSSISACGLTIPWVQCLLRNQQHSENVRFLVVHGRV